MAIDAASRRDAEPKAAGRTLSGKTVRELYTEADLPAGIGGPPASDPIGKPGRGTSGEALALNGR